jgi:SAM-dependent methyltransferase
MNVSKSELGRNISDDFISMSNAQLLEYCLENSNGIDVDAMRELAMQTIRYYRGSNVERSKLRPLQDLEAKWYESLKNGTPDYSVYESDVFVAETWSCYCIYSKGYIKNFARLGYDYNTINKVVDLGCGVGFTTAHLKELTNATNVVGTNVKGYQFDVATRMGNEFGFEVLTGFSDQTDVDLVFASEYFEHFLNPIDHLMEVLEMKPKMLIIANSFSPKSVGHFDEYLIDGKLVINKKVGRLFNNALRTAGYKSVKTGFYNNRPYVWELV